MRGRIYTGAIALSGIFVALSGASLLGGSLPAGATGSGTGAATGSPLTFGVLATNTGSSAAPEDGQALEAYVANWNAHGGYKGHRIVLNVDDTAGNLTTTTNDARALVTQNNVLAFINNYNLLDCTVNGSYYASVPVADIGVEATTSCYNSTVDFPTSNPGGTIGLSVFPKWASTVGSDHIGILAPSVAGVSTLISALGTYVKKVTHHTLVQASVPLVPTAAQLDAAFVQLKAQKVDAVIMIVLAQTGASLAISEANTQGFGPDNGIRWMFGGASISPVGITGAYDELFTYPWSSSIPQVKQARKLLEAKGITEFDAASAIGYQNGALLQQTLDAVKGPVTRASILTALHGLKSVPLALTPLRIDLANPSSDLEGGVIEVSKNGKFVPASSYLST